MALQIWLPLNEDLHNQGLNQNVTVTNHGAVVNDSGKIGKCYSFNGSNNYLSCNYNFYNNKYGVSAWIYSTSSTATQTICCDRTAVGSGFSIFLIGGKIRIDSGGNNLQWTTNYTYPINTWFHLTVVYDGTNVLYYINGKYQEKKAQSISASYWGNIISIGASQDNGSNYDHYLNGKLNDIRIYDHTLSPKEVEDISKALILHYPLNDNLINPNNLFTGTAFTPEDQANFVGTSSTDWTKYFRYYNGNAGLHTFENGVDTIKLSVKGNIGIAFVRKATEIGLDPSKYYTISCEAKCSQSGAQLSIGLSYYTNGNAWTWRGGDNKKTFSAVDEWQTFTLTFKPNSNTQYICYCFTVYGANNGTDTFSIRHCKLEQGSTATTWFNNIIYDSSGYGNNGTIVGNLTAAAGSPRYEAATQFDGSSYILTPSGSFNWWDFEQGTFCAWINPSATASSWSGSVGIAGDNGYNKKAFSISYYANSFRPVYCNQAYSTIETGKSLPLNEWHFCVATVNGTEIKTYFDGEPVNTTTIDWSTATIPTDLRFQVGVDLPGTDEKFNGKYSDIKFYATALTPAQVKELYQTSMLVDASGNIIPRGLED